MMSLLYDKKDYEFLSTIQEKTSFQFTVIKFCHSIQIKNKSLSYSFFLNFYKETTARGNAAWMLKAKEAVCSCISTFVSYFFYTCRIGLSNISKVYSFKWTYIIQLKNKKQLVPMNRTAYIVYTFHLTLHHANFDQFKAKQVLCMSTFILLVKYNLIVWYVSSGVSSAPIFFSLTLCSQSSKA